MKSPSRRVLVASALVLMSFGVFQACKKKDDDGPAPLVPPTLEFLGATNTQGDSFEPGDDIVLACDGYLTLLLGPEGESDGTILNWTLNPPNICGSIEQCGYVTVELLDAEGGEVAKYQQVVASPFLDLSSVELEDVTQIRATLTLGDSGVPFEDEGTIVAAVWDGGIEKDCTAPGDGGAGGADAGSGGAAGTGGTNGSGGSDTASGGSPALGGAGGFGGSGSN